MFIVVAIATWHETGSMLWKQNAHDVAVIMVLHEPQGTNVIHKRLPHSLRRVCVCVCHQRKKCLLVAFGFAQATKTEGVRIVRITAHQMMMK